MRRGRAPPVPAGRHRTFIFSRNKAGENADESPADQDHPLGGLSWYHGILKKADLDFFLFKPALFTICGGCLQKTIAFPGGLV
jgi:hypothetical protein